MNSMTGTARPDFRPLPACPAGTQDLKPAAIISTAAPLHSLPGRKPGFAALRMFHRAELSVPVGQANRGGLVFHFG